MMKSLFKKPVVPSIVSQLKALETPLARYSFYVVAPIAAFVPISVFALTWSLFYDTAHPVGYDFAASWQTNPLICILIAGGFLFSAKSVYTWGLSAFGVDRLKAVGYCLIIEGTLIASPYLWLKIVAGFYLLAINMLAAGSLQATLAHEELEKDDTPDSIEELEVAFEEVVIDSEEVDEFEDEEEEIIEGERELYIEPETPFVPLEPVLSKLNADKILHNEPESINL